MMPGSKIDKKNEKMKQDTLSGLLQRLLLQTLMYSTDAFLTDENISDLNLNKDWLPDHLRIFMERQVKDLLHQVSLGQALAHSV